jgi:hypothetical protein
MKKGSDMSTRAEEKERRREWAEKEAWRQYKQALSKLDDPVAAERMADQGIPNGEIGGHLYHNLGCFLNGHNPDTKPNEDQWKAFIAFVQRAEAAGKMPAGSVKRWEQNFESWKEHIKEFGPFIPGRGY